MNDDYRAAREEFLRDVFIMAIEGGINYWAGVYEYRHSTANWYAVILDTEEFDTKAHRIDRRVINRGIRRVYRARPTPGLLSPDTTIKHLSRRTKQRLDQAIRAMDSSELDADDADIIVQVGLFGEVVYG